MKTQSSTPNSFPSQSVESYEVHGPQKIEKSNANVFQEQDTRFVLEYVKAKEKYNELRQQGKTHGEAWRLSHSYTLPLENQLMMKKEIEEKNPGFYSEARKEINLMSKSLEKKSIVKSKPKWNITYSKEDIERISKSFEIKEDLIQKLSKCGIPKETIESLAIKD